MRLEADIWSLNNHLLVKILEKLDEVVDRKSWRLTCKRFYAAGAESQKTMRLFNSELLPRALARHTGIESLDLSSCIKITDEDLALVGELAGTRLRSLGLARMGGFTVAGIVALARNCSALVELDLRCCNSLGDLELAAVCQLGSLRKLDLTGCYMISDAGLGCLAAGCKKLQVVVLKGCVGISDAGLCFLASNCKELTTIDVSYTEITDDGVRCLSNLPSLRVLNLAACSNVGDAGLTRTSTSLLELDLSCCRSVTNVGISFLSKRSLQFLKLGFCSPVKKRSQITGQLLEAVGKLTQIQTLKLAGCEIAGDGLRFVGSCCLQLSDLSLSKCRGVTDSGMASIFHGCKNLRKLDLTCCLDLTEITAYNIARSSAGLVSLKIEACRILTENNIPLLMERCSCLEELDVTDCNIDDAGLECIAKCKFLKTLKLGFCKVSDNGIEHVGRNCSDLIELDLYRSGNVGDAGVASIAAGCRKLRILNLSYCPNITDASIVSISQLSHLQQLEIRGCKRVGLEKKLPEFKNLVELDLKHCGIGDRGMTSIVYCFPNLQQLNLSYCRISNAGLVMLGNLRCLQNVKLVQIGDVSIEVLAAALLSCVCLKKAKLFCNALLNDSINARYQQLEDRGCRIRWMIKPER
ncbi:hypothetical protein SELMODRAFT_87311 [Selaginella moellendorffii]|uniref:F-box/LRR-repeat protein 15-like leucin rich repeat domain-containing protein n=1 Tax=Selaginella moellendorffii TaxID=88036 RepID=D8R8K7_SELML|nr:hypothetical protein SELMODRAFT_87311 [Selaginella moellendorffii]